MTVCKKKITEQTTLASMKWRDLRDALAVIGVDIPENTRVDVSRFGAPQCHQFFVESDEDTIGFTYVDGCNDGGEVDAGDSSSSDVPSTVE